MLVSSRVVDHPGDQDLQQPEELRTQNLLLTTKTMPRTAFIRTALPRTQQSTPTLTGMLVQGVPLSPFTFTTGQ